MVRVPILEIVRLKFAVLAVKVAVQDVAAFKVTEPVLQPVPLQPVKVEPDAGVAVRATTVPLLKVAEQVVPQLMPAGELVTVPLPLPDLATDRLDVCRLKVAVQEVAAFKVTEPVVQPVPLQPVKVEPDAGVAVRATTVPLLKVVEQVVPQLMPAGELVTVPLPVPAKDTVRLKVANAAAVVAQVSGEYGEAPAELNALTR